MALKRYHYSLSHKFDAAAPARQNERTMSYLFNRQDFPDLTDGAYPIVEQINQRAAARGFLQTELRDVVLLMLWTLLRWERKVGQVVLEELGVDLDHLASDVNSGLRARGAERKFRVENNSLVDRQTGAPIYLSDLKSSVIEFLNVARAESKRMGHTYVGSEHLLLTICRLADAELQAILDRYGVSAPLVEARIHRVLGTPPTPDSRPDSAMEQ
ncbi:MAG: Clp protease N-terminal domain-containing protein [Pirellulales bacterium]